MGMINRFTKRCIFCKSKAGYIKYVSDFDSLDGFGFGGNWYHKACLKAVVCDPTWRPKRIINKALYLITCIKNAEGRVDGTADALVKACNYLKQSESEGVT